MNALTNLSAPGTKKNLKNVNCIQLKWQWPCHWSPTLLGHRSLGFPRESPGLPGDPRIARLYSFSHLRSNSISSLSALSRLWEEAAQKRDQSHQEVGSWDPHSQPWGLLTKAEASGPFIGASPCDVGPGCLCSGRRWTPGSDLPPLGPFHHRGLLGGTEPIQPLPAGSLTI